ALLTSTALCGSILGGVVGSLLVDQAGYDAMSTVLGGIAFGGGAGLVLAAAIALRVTPEVLGKYSRIAMVMAILFLGMLLVRRYRMEQQLRDHELELVPVKLSSIDAIAANPISTNYSNGATLLASGHYYIDVIGSFRKDSISV
ncbi:MAG: hypothetical protein HKN13_09860, partial [Rhodothermales bacterium]|nr:hypothetical protein [Rhodothermales bacterium]